MQWKKMFAFLRCFNHQIYIADVARSLAQIPDITQLSDDLSEDEAESEPPVQSDEEPLDESGVGESDGDKDENDRDHAERAKKRRKKGPSRDEKFRTILLEYYTGTYYGQSAAVIAYYLGIQIGKSSIDHLWYPRVNATNARGLQSLASQTTTSISACLKRSTSKMQKCSPVR